MGISGTLIGEKRNATSHSKVTFLCGKFEIEVANGGPNSYDSFVATKPANDWNEMDRMDQLVANAKITRLAKKIGVEPEGLTL